MIAARPAARLFGRARQIATGPTGAVTANLAVTNFLRIFSSMTLTRLLDAHAYGVVSIITSVAYVLTMLAEVGLVPFVIRHAEGGDARFLDQLWTIRLVRGFFLTVAMIAVAHPAAHFLGKPEVAPVIMVWAVNFLIDGASSMALATAVREQKLWRLSSMELSANLFTLIVSVSLALALRSYWAMVGGMLGGALMKAGLSYALFPHSRRRWNFARDRMRELWDFSRYMAWSSMLSLVILQSDKLVLARLMPLATYGLYAIATTLAAAPVMLATTFSTRVLYPLYAKVHRETPELLRRMVYRRQRKFAFVYMAGVGLLIGAAPLLVELLYDPRFRGVSAYLRLLAISSVLAMPSRVANQALIAVGRTRSTFYSNIFRLAWLAIGGGIGLLTGNIMLVVATVGTVEAPGLLCFWVNMRQAGLLDLRQEALGLGAAGLGVGVGLALTEAAGLLFGF